MKPMLRFRIRSLLIVTALICTALSFGVCRTHLHILAAMVSNDDITLDVSSATLELTGPSRVLAWFGDDSRPVFLNLLKSPDKFAAAHVALTELTEQPSWFSGRIELTKIGEQEYNRMSCRVDGSGLEIDDLDSQPPLKEWWDDYFPLAERREQSIVNGGIMMFGDLDFSDLVASN
jgi:hypothetical protein